ncbi:nucleoside hydrolase [Agromyces binzhouensis]|uniref:Nucleoside hydrolase n=1 Tax=Agromyces binzhouensis TaxID=1817495 RepID=A0A4Q2J850_9MICO|nr:nucleoside hydrolase [Agromyces binzhouensis]RXZ40319.1 nucleoside hydrolase [Agromyces binzhouensis]
MTDAIPVYLDCDTGIDDAVALAYLLAHPGVRVVGIGTVSGNVSAERAAANTLALLAASGVDDVPVAVGSADPLGGTFHGGAPQVHGEDGVGGVGDALPAATRLPEATTDAAGLLIRLAGEHAAELRVLAVGPLTNLAVALRRDPGLAGRVHSVTVMGGALDAPGNVSLVAEANLRNDPAAAAGVLAASWPVTLVPLDVTTRHTFDEGHRTALLAAPGLVPRLLGAMLDAYFEFYTVRYGERRCALHDPLAAAAVAGDVAEPTWRRGWFDVVDDDAHGDHGRMIELESRQPADEADRPASRALMGADEAAADRILRRILDHAWPAAVAGPREG